MILNKNTSNTIISEIEKITGIKCPWEINTIDRWCKEVTSIISKKSHLKIKETPLSKEYFKKSKVDGCKIKRKTPIWIGEVSNFFGQAVKENNIVEQVTPDFYFYIFKNIYIYQFYEFGPIVFNENFEVITELSTPFYKLLLIEDENINNDVNIFNGLVCAISDRFLENNYAHWLLDTIPRIKGYHLLDTDKNNINFLTNPVSTKWQKNMLAAYDIKNYFSLTKNQITNFSNIVLPQDFGSIVLHPALKANPNTLRDLNAINNKERSYKKSDVLLIERKGTRKLTNQNELIQYLEKNGLTTKIIDPSEIDFNSQVYYFNSHRFIISVHGAALANTIFMNEDSYLFEIMPKSYGNPAFWLLASTKGVNYYCVTDVQDDLNDTDNRPRNKNIIITKESIDHIVSICKSAK